MRLRTLIEASVIVKLARKLWRGYGYFEELLGSTSETSLSYKIMVKFWDKVKIYSRYSFLGRISEIRQNDNTEILEKSKVLIFLIKLYKKWKYQLAYYLKISRSYALTEEFKKEYYFQAVKVTSTIVIIAVMTNIIFTILLRQRVELLGWFMRGLLLFVGICGLNSHLDWSTLRGTSISLKLFSKKCAGFAER